VNWLQSCFEFLRRDRNICRPVITWLCMSVLHIVHLPPRPNVPVKHTWWTSAFTIAWGCCWWCGLLPNYFGHVFFISNSQNDVFCVMNGVMDVVLPVKSVGLLWLRAEKLVVLPDVNQRSRNFLYSLTDSRRNGVAFTSAFWCQHR